MVWCCWQGLCWNKRCLPVEIIIVNSIAPISFAYIRRPITKFLWAHSFVSLWHQYAQNQFFQWFTSESGQFLRQFFILSTTWICQNSNPRETTKSRCSSVKSPRSTGAPCFQRKYVFRTILLRVRDWLTQAPQKTIEPQLHRQVLSEGFPGARN